MKRILNIIGIFFLSIIVFTSCQKSPEELNEGSPQTRAAGVTGTYYWYKTTLCLRRIIVGLRFPQMI